MLRGLYTAASGMLSAMVATDTLANNMANVDTAGFKKSVANFKSFPEVLMQRVAGDQNQTIGRLSTGNVIRSTAVDFRQGPMHQTGNPLDIALEGEGFFTVLDEKGNESYTRNGSFVVNPDGFLATNTGELVQGELGNILMTQDQGEIRVDGRGTITQGGRVVDTLKITRFNNNHTLLKKGNSLFAMSNLSHKLEEPGVGVPLPYKVHQWKLEDSNAGIVQEMVNSITGMRLYEALQKNIQTQNMTLGKAVNEVGRYST